MLFRSVFAGQRVVGRLGVSVYKKTDILELIDVVTGKLVLEVGTDYSDDYYPSFVANFNPEAMALNSKPVIQQITWNY